MLLHELPFLNHFPPLQMARTQRNKATASHLGVLKARLAKLRRELITPKGGGGGPGEGFDVAKTGDARVGFVGEWVGREWAGLYVRGSGVGGWRTWFCRIPATEPKSAQRRYDVHHEMLTQRALFCHHANTKRGTLSQRRMSYLL